MALDGIRYRKLEMALLSAFPTQGALTRLVKYHLDQSLVAIAGGANLREVVFNLIEWAISQNRLSDLMRGAREESPGNLDLKAVDQELEHAQPPTKDLSGLGPLLRWADQNGQLGQLIALACGPEGKRFDVEAFASRTLAGATERASVEGSELLERAEAQSSHGVVIEAYRAQPDFQLESFGGLESMPVHELVRAPEPLALTDRTELLRLADEYEAVRASRPASDQRTRLQQRVASQMSMLAPRASSMLAELADSERPGRRLAAVMMLLEEPTRDRLTWLAERMAKSEHPFIAFQAALALRNAVRELPGEEPAVQTAIERGLAILRAEWPDTYGKLDRTHVLSAALASFSRTVG